MENAEVEGSVCVIRQLIAPLYELLCKLYGGRNDFGSLVQLRVGEAHEFGCHIEVSKNVFYLNMLPVLLRIGGSKKLATIARECLARVLVWVEQTPHTGAVVLVAGTSILVVRVPIHIHSGNRPSIVTFHPPYVQVVNLDSRVSTPNVGAAAPHGGHDRVAATP